MVQPAHPRLILPITPAKHTLLQTLGRYEHMTADQACALLYAPGSLTFVRSLLRDLAEDSYLLRLYLPRRARAGSSPAVFTLAHGGIRYLREAGIDVPDRFRRIEVEERGYLHLAHSLAISEVVLTFELFCKATPAVVLAEYRQERLLRRTPVRVELPGGTKISVVPDGWLDLRVQPTKQRICLALEVDRGTMMKRQWHRKVAALVAFASSPSYGQVFHARTLSILVIAMTGRKRHSDMLRWTEQELTKLGKQDQADLFRFIAWPEHRPSPPSVLLHPLWARPFSTECSPLLSLEVEGAP